MWHPVGNFRRRGLLGLLILRMLESGPMNGVELMETIEKRTHYHHSHWRPSPGSVYPRLKELADEGLISKRPDGRYELTGKSRAGVGRVFASRPRTATQTVVEINALLEYLEDMQSLRPEETAIAPGDIDAIIERFQKLKRKAR